MEVDSQRDVSPQYLSLMDLLMEVWNEAYPALWNVRILIADIYSYVAKYAIEDTHAACRDHKGLDMIRMLRDLYKVMEAKISRDGVFTRMDMQRFIRCNVSRELQERLFVGTMNEDTYDELANEYDSFVPGPTTRSDADEAAGERDATTQTTGVEVAKEVRERKRNATSRGDDDNDVEVVEARERKHATTRGRDDDVVVVEVRERKNVTTRSDDDDDDDVEVVKEMKRTTPTTGLDGVFASMAGQAAQQAAGGLIPQTVTKIESGRMFVIRTPGEIGDKVIRLSVYNADDVRDKEKRDWWRYTKLRAQFLSSSLTSTDDRRSRVLRELFDVVTNHLTTVPGVLKEVRELFMSGYPDQEDRGGMKRRSGETRVEVAGTSVDEPASRSDSVVANADDCGTPSTGSSRKRRCVFRDNL